MGGGIDQNSTSVMQNLAKLVPNRPPQPKKCDLNWNTTNCPRLVLITSAAPSQADGNQAYQDDSQQMSYRSMFIEYGIAPMHASVHIDNYKNDRDLSTQKGQQNLFMLKNADIIFFNGGDQSRHIRSWYQDNGTECELLKIIKQRIVKDQAIAAGTSAGAMIWTKFTYGQGSSFGILYFKNLVDLAPKKITDGGVNESGLTDTRNGTKSLQYDYNGGKMPAFNMIDFFVDTHFDDRGRLGRMPAALTSIGQKLGVGVDQNTTLYYDNGIGTVYGSKGITFCDLSSAVQEPYEYFTMSGVVVHYLMQGDKYDFQAKKVISNKNQIKTPFYNNPTDSNNILAGYQISLLLKRLVDQKAAYNVGKTKAPSSFPSTTPVFQLIFYKNQKTKGYYESHTKRYTVENALVDFDHFSKVKNLLSQ